MSTLSLRARLTLWYTLALLVVLGLFAADVLWVQSRIGLRRVDRELEGLVTTLTNVIHAELAEQVSLETAAEEAPIHGGRRRAGGGDFRCARQAARGELERPRAARLVAIRANARRVWTEQTPAGGWRLHARSQRFDTMSLTFLVGSTLADVRARTATKCRKR